MFKRCLSDSVIAGTKFRARERGKEREWRNTNDTVYFWVAKEKNNEK